MPVLVSIIAANVLIFLFGFTSSGGDQMRYSRNFLSLGWKDNGALADGEYYRLLSSTFLHANFSHLFVNMWSLYNVGVSALVLFGAVNFFMIYLVSGITGSLASWWFNANPSVGASGAIFGVLGSLFSYAIISGRVDLMRNILLVLIVNAAFGFIIPMIDNWGHAGGFVGGFAVGAYLAYFGSIN